MGYDGVKFLAIFYIFQIPYNHKHNELLKIATLRSFTLCMERWISMIWSAGVYVEMFTAALFIKVKIVKK